MNYEPGTRFLYAGDIDRKIEEYQRQGDLYDGLEDWEEDELNAMLAFREDAKNALYQWEKGTAFISDLHFGDWAQQEAEDLYGKEAVQSGYFNVDRYTEDRRDQFQEIPYNGHVYLADGN